MDFPVIILVIAIIVLILIVIVRFKEEFKNSRKES